MTRSPEWQTCPGCGETNRTEPGHTEQHAKDCPVFCPPRSRFDAAERTRFEYWFLGRLWWLPPYLDGEKCPANQFTMWFRNRWRRLRGVPEIPGAGWRRSR